MTLCTAVSPPAISCSSFRRLRIANFRTPSIASRIYFNGGDRKTGHSSSLPRIDAQRLRLPSTAVAAGGGGGGSVSELNDDVRKLLQVNLWIAEAVYIVWLFLLPYAPVSTISPSSYWCYDYASEVSNNLGQFLFLSFSVHLQTTLITVFPWLSRLHHVGGSSLGHQFRHNQFSNRPFSQLLLHPAFDKLWYYFLQFPCWFFLCK